MAFAKLDVAQIACFQKEGYLVLPAIASLEEIAQLREIFDRLFQNKSGWEAGAQYDLAGTDDEGRAALPQILNPVDFAPELRAAPIRARALEIARQLLGPETEPWFEHAILKPPGYGAPTPWHQDEAHRKDTGTTYEQVSIWVPLQEATVENGCIRFIAGSQRGPVLPHGSPNDDPRISALECTGPFDPATAVPCPLPPGGATIHHCRTLHGSGANTTDAPRRAYILAFRGKVRPDPSFTGYPWNAEKRTAALERSRAWQARGGVIARLVRRSMSVAARLAGAGRRS